MKPSGWKINQVVGFSISNPRKVCKVSGSPEEIMKLLMYIRDNHPEQLDEDMLREIEIYEVEELSDSERGEGGFDKKRSIK